MVLHSDGGSLVPRSWRNFCPNALAPTSLPATEGNEQQRTQAKIPVAETLRFHHDVSPPDAFVRRGAKREPQKNHGRGSAAVGTR